MNIDSRLYWEVNKILSQVNLTIEEKSYYGINMKIYNNIEDVVRQHTFNLSDSIKNQIDEPITSIG